LIVKLLIRTCHKVDLLAKSRNQRVDAVSVTTGTYGETYHTRC
jgi:hypothetical protein